jgi:hypothetical protein
MHAAIGDRIVVPSHKVGTPQRTGEVLGVGPEGGPPYRVRWDDTRHEALFFPSADAYVERATEKPVESKQ